MSSRRTLKLLAVAVSAVATVGATIAVADAATTAVSAGTQHLAVPAYFSPGSYWTQLTQAGSAVGAAIANPNNGPGSAFDQSYANAIRTATNAGVKVIGYVDTGYFGTTGRTTRTGSTSSSAWTTQAEADVASWYSMYGSYGLGGIFFDDGLTDCGHVGLYQAVNTYTKQNHAGAYTVDNPGGAADSCYASAADSIVMFEGTYATYQSWTAPSWELNSTNPNQFWNLVYATPTEANMVSAMSHGKQQNAGYMYVTPDDLPNPWDTLPTGTYWSSELTQAASGGGGTTPTCTTQAGSGSITAYSACGSNGTVTFKATFNASSSYHHVFLNTDGNTATGYQLPSPSPTALGADYMIEQNTLYKSTSTGWAWTATATSPAMTVSGSTYTWTFPTSALTGSVTSQQAIFNINSAYTAAVAYTA